MVARVYSDSVPAVTLLGTTTTSGGVASGDTNMVLSASLNTYFNSTFPFELRIEPDTANEEVVLVSSGTGLVGSPYVVTRGYSNGVTGSNLTAKAHAQGASVRHGFSAIDLSESNNHINVGRGTHGSAVAGERVSSGAASKTATTTVSNTATETVIHTYTIAGNDAVAGAYYKLVVWGSQDNVITAVPTITLRARLGGVAGTQIGGSFVATAPIGAQTNKTFRFEVELSCRATGASATWLGTVQGDNNLPTTAAHFYDGTSATFTKDSTVSNDLVITAQWSAANPSDTLRADAGYGERIY